MIRPESLLLCFGCIALFYFYNYCQAKKVSKKELFWLEFSLGGLIETHMIVALFGGAIGISLFIFVKKHKLFSDIKWIILGNILPIGIFVCNILYTIIFSGMGKQVAKATPSLDIFKKNFSIFFLDNYVMGFKRLFMVMVEVVVLVFACFNIFLFVYSDYLVAGF